jgi:hypothetical protein
MNGGFMNQLTPEQLDMIKRLQPLFKKKMGDWQASDDFQHGNRTGFIEAIGGDIIRLHFMWNGLSSGSRIIYKRSWHELLRIPKPIDWQNPERGLWGMIDSDEIKLEKFTSSMEDVHYFLAIGDRKVIIESNLFTALLKALCEQEEV